MSPDNPLTVEQAVRVLRTKAAQLEALSQGLFGREPPGPVEMLEIVANLTADLALVTYLAADLFDLEPVE